MITRFFAGPVALLAAAAALAVAEDKGKPHPLEGTWLNYSYEKYGVVRESRKDELSTWTFANGKLQIRSPIPDSERDETYTVDDTKTPRHLDLKWTIKDKDYHAKCLYEIKGDMLRIVVPFSAKDERPTKMASSIEGRIQNFKRVKK